MVRRQRGIHRLRAKELNLLATGWHDDGAGLRLRVEAAGSRSWVQRLTINGRRVNRGLGGFPLVDLDAARDASYAVRQAVRDGRDLAREKRLEAAKATTFRQAFKAYFAVKAQQLSNVRHRGQWTTTMETYVLPTIGNMSIGEVTASDIIKVLEPIWVGKAETAKRVLQRIKAIFDYAIVQEWRESDPCRGVAQSLGGTGHRRVKNHRALKYQEVPAFIQTLRSGPSSPITKLAYEWLILTITRSGETREAPWNEIDKENALWVIPPERMKAKAPHVVPLSSRCLEILQEVRDLQGCGDCTGLIFPSPVRKTKRFTPQHGLSRKPLSNMTLTKVLRDMGVAEKATAHGFRTSFRTWATEVDKCREVVAEAALAHAIKDKTEAAYRRTSYLEERVGLMQRWADFCAGGG